MRIIRLITIVFAAAAFAACSSPTTTNTANTAPADANQAAAESKPAVSSLSPTDALKALSAASAKQDVENIKRYLSKGTLARLELGAQEQNTTADALLREKDGAPFPKLPELGKEEIKGDTATVEVMNVETKQFERLPFVKEDGEWKVAIDVYLDNLDDAMMEKEQEKPTGKRP